MKKLSIYLDTSIINFLFADDAPEKKEITIDFFDNFVQKNVYNIYISPIVIDEINRTKEKSKKDMLLDVISKYNIHILDIRNNMIEIEALASKYIQDNIIPKGKIDDALHVAISTVFEIEILLSWNYKHLVNIHKERKFTSINLSEGYFKNLKLTTPYDVVYYDEDE